MLGAFISAVPLAWAWQAPNTEQWAYVLLVGLFGTLGQILLTRGYATAPTARVAPFTYFSVLFGSAYGYLFWGEILNLHFVAGALLIAFAGILALRRRAEIRIDENLDPGRVAQIGSRGARLE